MARLLAWLRKNGADVTRSGVRNTVRESDDAKVVPVNAAIRCIAGDTITTYMSTDNITGSTGLYYYAPAGEASIPSIITTIYKISD